MASGNLYNETLRSAMREQAPRESKAWIGWLFLGMMAGGSIMGVWDIYQDRVRLDERVSASYRGAAESQSRGQLSQPTAAPR